VKDFKRCLQFKIIASDIDYNTNMKSESFEEKNDIQNINSRQAKRDRL